MKNATGFDEGVLGPSALDAGAGLLVDLHGHWADPQQLSDRMNKATPTADSGACKAPRAVASGARSADHPARRT